MPVVFIASPMFSLSVFRETDPEVNAFLSLPSLLNLEIYDKTLKRFLPKLHSPLHILISFQDVGQRGEQKTVNWKLNMKKMKNHQRPESVDGGLSWIF